MNNRDWKPMRQGQQNRRGRGRNNNNNNNQNNQHRKGQNPLTRSFESNGPDMKIRGTPAHIAEKYIALARDAHSAGDPVLAENYLQHAEHYNRIILAYREQQMSQGGDVNMVRPRPAQLHDSVDDEDGAEEDMQPDPGDAPQPQVRHIEGAQPQPQPQPQRIYDNQQRFEQPREGRDRDRDRDNRQQRFGQDGQPMRRPHRDRFDRNDRNDRGERGFQGNRFQGERGDRYGERQDRGGQPERHQERTGDRPADGGDRMQAERPPNDRPERGVEVSMPPADVEATQPPRSETPRRRERFAQSAHEQPEFLRRPVRRPRREAATEDEAGPATSGPAPVAADESGD